MTFSGDRLRSDADLRVLDGVAEFLGANQILWWFDQGSALGAVRDGHFLPWDHDLDTSVWASDFAPHRRAFVRAMHRRGFRVQVTPHVVQVGAPLRQPGVDVDVRLYERDDDQAVCRFRHLGPRGGVRWRALSAMVRGVGVCHRTLDWVGRQVVGSAVVHDAVASIARWTWAVRNRLLQSTEFTVDASFFDRFEMVSVSGRSGRVPAAPEHYLALKYGPDWRTPKRDWTYWTDDGALRR